ncbi:pyruvate:ferredoxin oxidoreductase and related 2-oxoacid:ferredoxin oxidoreductases, alpha subunit [Candidatus Scalindua japonica]|uniref:Pyruvate:ferredoxin oxidoreductase and related 2-oxoacid:ferredoxin oxidoreductases, alpha subunit n=1 Tax=Candidatus Scalindua japonica TaxID=1284222 RepID=A0A286U0K1_9BACT|nr:2-oxoacid:acceptor oxidoreductase subunit alpha [Candidatus Scalindua japonica]GAX61657.1 pyruvate:ferredoxin oxidoreductase and related 2-oxoacid:ferredoxin oxidoreductases, alpha subunit [Candidatus Scalindua japonica]
MSFDFNITIAGSAGQGLQTIANILLKILARNGYHVFSSQDYMSRIRGGHNFTNIRVSNKPIYSTNVSSQLLIALDQQSVDIHYKYLADPAIIIHDSDSIKVKKSTKIQDVSVPLAKLSKESGNPAYVNSAAVGALFALLKLDLNDLVSFLETRFKKKSIEQIKGNINAATKGFTYASENYKNIKTSIDKVRKKNRMLINGAESISIGMIAGGIRLISAYPMTPSTGIFTYITGKARKFGIISEQAEDEIAACNIALGASAAGARAAVTTSGGGLSLMSEGISLAGAAEIPIVIANMQRPGPATGLPTRTAQEDLNFVLNIGHGEFPRFVFAPGTAEEAFYTSIHALNLAEKYQVPVFILGDQHLIDCCTTLDKLNLNKIKYKSYMVKSDKLEKPYLRYKNSKNGISPLAYYGQDKVTFIVDSHLHTEDGHISEDKDVAKKLTEKRFRKIKGMKKEFYGPQYYGLKNAKSIFISWGSTYGAVRETVDYLLEKKKSVAMIHYNKIWPFPVEESIKLIKSRKEIYVVENNYQAQFNCLLMRETNVNTAEPILRYDGRPFNVQYIIEKYEKRQK